MELIIHIGLPRTATTMLQSHVFPKLENTILLQKRPYSSRIGSKGEKGKMLSNATDIGRYLRSLDPFIFADSPEQQVAMEQSLVSTAASSTEGPSYALLLEHLEFLVRAAAISDGKKRILISAERLVDTRASLCGWGPPLPNRFEQEFPIFSLLRAASDIGVRPRVIVCFRDIIPYLVSKFVRTVIQRQAMKYPGITIESFLEGQFKLEKVCPLGSVISPLRKNHFIGTLEKNSDVTALAFEKLKDSKDLMRDLSIESSARCAFSDFPVENDSPITSEAKAQLIDRVTEYLNRHDIKTTRDQIL